MGEIRREELGDKINGENNEIWTSLKALDELRG